MRDQFPKRATGIYAYIVNSIRLKNGVSNLHEHYFGTNMSDYR